MDPVRILPLEQVAHPGVARDPEKILTFLKEKS
jgi:hypothetical protein